MLPCKIFLLPYIHHTPGQREREIGYSLSHGDVLLGKEKHCFIVGGERNSGLMIGDRKALRLNFGLLLGEGRGVVPC